MGWLAGFLRQLKLKVREGGETKGRIEKSYWSHEEVNVEVSVEKNGFRSYVKVAIKGGVGGRKQVLCFSGTRQENGRSNVVDALCKGI